MIMNIGIVVMMMMMMMMMILQYAWLSPLFGIVKVNRTYFDNLLIIKMKDTYYLYVYKFFIILCKTY